jgi:glucosylceramidase
MKPPITFRVAALFGLLNGVVSAVTFAATPQAVTAWVDNSLEGGIAANPLQTSAPVASDAKPDAVLVIEPEKKFQTMAGIGAAFSEIGGLALADLPEAARDAILTSLFDPDKGAGFSMCRLPVGSSDFANSAYSYAETPGDLTMSHFSLERDERSIIPAAQGALKKNPALRFFASPWSPPGWMKPTGKMDKGGTENHLRDTEEIYNAYTLYFEKYLQGYAAHGIKISRLCPQNEMDNNATYPGCVMPPAQLTKLVVDHLAPAFRKDGIDTEIWPGTFREKPKAAWATECMQNEAFRKVIGGLGIQYYDGKLIEALGAAYPGTRFMHTEAACGWGKNTPREAGMRLREILSAILVGCDAFAYWNMLLDENQKSGWGWAQNSLATIDRPAKTFRFNPDYQPLYLASRFVRPGDVRVKATWSSRTTQDIVGMVASFLEPDGSITTLLQNNGNTSHVVELQVHGHSFKVQVSAHSDVGIRLSDAL